MRKRRTARVLLFDPGGRVLLIRFTVPREGGEFVFWAAPGGEIEAGETEMEAARRELGEELGLEVVLTGPIRTESNSFEHQGEMRANTDYFFRGECAAEAPRLLGVTEDEIRIMKEIRWFTRVELVETRVQVFPRDLAEWIGCL